MAFKVGDKVKYIDQVGTAKVLKIQKDRVLVLNEDDFEIWVGINDIVIAKALTVDTVLAKDSPTKPRTQKVPVKDRNIMEQDLHIHHLVENTRGMSNFQMLQLQLEAAQKAILRARRANAPKLILIHGVGEGKLREELHTLLESLDGISFYDASFLKYGAGATEVELW